MDTFIGEKRIASAAVIEEKSPAGNEMVKVVYEDGAEEVMPKLRSELLISDKRSDASTVQSTLKVRVAAMMYSTLHEYGVKMGEVNSIIDAVTLLVNSGYDKARTLKFGFEFDQLPLIEINKILLNETTTTKSDNGPTSA
jgi:hypothetical protein